jgi:hypothetical protein
MVLSIVLLLGVAAFIVTIASAIGKAPLWIAVLLLTIIALLQTMPIR